MATYQTLYNQALSAIKNACYNVSNYSSLPSQYKSGFSYTQQNGIAYLTWNISNPIYQIATSTVDSDFSNFMSNYGITSILGSTTTPRGLLNFYSALATFCSARVCVASSQLHSGRYLVYIQNGYSSFNRIPEDSLIYATDVNSICNNINSIISSNSKGYQVTYTNYIH